jgi:two-component system response regulator GlrR
MSNPSVHVLLLEDEPLLLELMAQALAAQGFLVTPADSYEEAASVLNHQGWETFDIVVSDLHLGRDPEALRGWEFLQLWSARFPVPPFIFLLGSGRLPSAPPDVPHLYELTKPFPFPDLVALIRSALCLV